MNKYVKEFCLRGLIFGGFGPIIVGIVYLCISLSTELAVSGKEFFSAIISTYLLAFVHAGASIFPQIESWSIIKSISVHFPTLYIAYTLCYLINTWIPFDWKVVLIYTAIFILVYLAIWVTVFTITKRTTKNLNKRI